jgi:hypothetical protein
MKIEYTNRGFEVIIFQDKYGESCSLQQSSLAEYEPPGSSAIWFGIEGTRMHLDLKLVKELLPYLQAWVENGSFFLSKEADK